MDSAQITNTFFPNSDNKNIANVKFTATVKVKIEGKLAQDLQKFRTASALFSEYEKEMVELDRSHKERLQSITKVRQAALDKYLAQEDARGNLTGDRQKHNEEMDALQSQREALAKESVEQFNAIFGKYKDRADNLLYATTSGSVRSYAEPSKPEIPLACFGYRDPRKPFGILYRAVMDGKGSSGDYYAGVETSIEGERQMIKTDNGWRVAGNL